MKYYRIRATIETESYYSQVVTEEDPFSAAFLPAYTGADLRALSYMDFCGRVEIAAAAEERCTGDSHAAKEAASVDMACRKLCDTAGLPRKALTIEQYEEITAGTFRAKVEDAACRELFEEETRLALLEGIPQVSKRLREGVEPQLQLDPDGSGDREDRLQKAADRQLDRIEAGGSLREEVREICAGERTKGFALHPDCYRLQAGTFEGAHRMCRLLMQTLYAKGGLQSMRFVLVNIEALTRGSTFDLLDQVLDDLQGGTCVLMTEDLRPGQDPQQRIRQEMLFGQLMHRYRGKILFVLAEKEPEAGPWQGAGAPAPEPPCRWMENVYQVVRIREKDAQVQDAAVLQDGKSAEEQLAAMPGLTQVKGVLSDLRASSSIARLRMEAGLPRTDQPLHMVFAGNPGTAKTTVARLTARMLHEDGLLQSPKLIECGRAQLVGEYVGWTAVQVRKRFEEARGGVLLIDEAYALATGSGSFGQEAIDAIVQEMENRRGDTAVIFTGYPEKMQDFLEKNEGLASRIPFHLEFPDYTEEELCEILGKMAEDQGYLLDPGAEESARETFAGARKHRDFGNGRFARNLLQQAALCQARRLDADAKAGRSLSCEALMRITREDMEQAGARMRNNAGNPARVAGFITQQ